VRVHVLGLQAEWKEIKKDPSGFTLNRVSWARAAGDAARKWTKAIEEAANAALPRHGPWEILPADPGMEGAEWMVHIHNGATTSQRFHMDVVNRDEVRFSPSPFFCLLLRCSQNIGRCGTSNWGAGCGV
jgi:anaerobic selenocysteine-containing dehydrogenase